MVVCHCAVVNDAVIREHIGAGHQTVEELAARCRAGSGCGGCRATIERLIRDAGRELVVAASLDGG
jgi:bacterioferritin-associated ferredoxin